MASSRLEQWEKQRAAIEERIKMAKARDKARERKADNKRKYLLGAMLLEWMDQDEAVKADADRRMESFLVRAGDRRAFGLAPLAKDAQKFTPPDESDSEDTEDPSVSAA